MTRDAGSPSEGNESEGTGRAPGRPDLPLAVIVIVAALLRLWAGQAVPLLLNDYRTDDLLYARQTESLLQGRWLGDYDAYALVKRPGYALFLAAARSIGLERRLAEDLLQIGAALAILLLLRRVGLSRVLAGLAFLLLIFSPATLGEIGSRLVRDGVHASQVLLAFGCAGGILVAGRNRTRLFLALVLAGLLAWCDLTREEGLWVLPALGSAAIALPFLLRRSGRRTSSTLILTAMVLLPSMITVPAVREMVRRTNAAHYGVALLSEIEEPGFESAVAALRSVALSRWRRFEPLDADLRRELAARSPAFAELAPHLDGGAWRQPSMIEKNGERLGIFFTWALRDAADRAGHHADAPGAAAFYARLGAEIRSAQDQGLLPRGGETSGQVPRPAPSLLPLFGRNLGRAMAECWRLADQTVNCLPRLPRNRVDTAGRRSFLAAAGPEALHVVTDVVERSALLEWFRRISAALLGFIPALGLIATLTQAAFLRRRGLDPAFAVEAMLVVAWVSRCALVAALETWWFKDVGAYLVPAYLLFIPWLAVSLDAHRRFPAPRRRGDRWSDLCSAHPRLAPGLALLLIGAAAISVPLLRPRLATRIGLITAPAQNAVLGSGFEEAYCLGPRDAVDFGADSLSFHPKLPGDTLHLHRPEVEVPPGRELVIEGECPTMPYGDPIRLRYWGLGAEPFRHEVLFFAAEGRQTWRFVLPVWTLENLEILDPLPAQGARLVIRRIALEPSAAAPAAPEGCRLQVAFDLAEGRVTAAISDGEPNSLYQLVFARRRLEAPTRFMDYVGEAWLDAATSLLDGDGTPYRFRLVTDATGRGQRSATVPGLRAEDLPLQVQGLGLRHLTPAVELR